MNKILFVIESLAPLGAVARLEKLISDLNANEFEFHVAVIGGKVEQELAHKRLSDQGVQVVRLGSPVVSNPFSRASFHAVSGLRKLIHRIQPDIVHAWCGMSEFISLAAGDLESWNSRFSTRSTVGNSLAPRRMVTEFFLQPEKRWSRQVYENRFSSGFEKVIVPHAAVRTHMIENGYDAEKIEIVPPPLVAHDVDRIVAQKALRNYLGIPQNSIVAGTVAPLVPRSRIKDLIWATDLLNVIRDDFHFVIFGNGHQRKRLEKFATQAGSRDRCHFVGLPINAGELVTGIDVFWQSHLTAPLSMNMMNAMAAEIPVISVYGAGTTELVVHQESGFAVNFGARDEFARWTKYLIEQPDSAKKLAAQGKSFVEQIFAPKKIGESYRAIYANG